MSLTQKIKEKINTISSAVDETTLHYIWLSLCTGFGTVSGRELVARYHGADAVYEAEEFESPLISPELRSRLMNKDLTFANEIYKKCKAKNISIISYESPLYPRRLRGITNPPMVLYYIGNPINLDNELCISIVGTRKPTQYGIEVTNWFSSCMAKSGAVIISGLAKGLDAVAHNGALSVNGYTVAVLGTAIDKIYPIENQSIFSQITDKGLIISEYYPECRAVNNSFPLRNRIISGLAHVVLITEADMTSGALITAKDAIAQNKKVYSIPGNITSSNSDGTNMLIRNGVQSALSPAEILENYMELFPTKLHIQQNAYKTEFRDKNNVEIKKDAATPQTDVTKTMSGDELIVYTFIKENAFCTCDDIINKTNMNARQVMATLSILEVQEYCVSLEGGKYKAV